MVAKTTGPGSPPSTTAGSTGETALNETTSFDGASEVIETANPFSPGYVRQPANIISMTTSELVNHLESQGAESGFLESMMSCEMTGAALAEMFASGAASPQEAVQSFSFTCMETFQLMAL